MANKQASFAVKLLDGLSRPARAMGGSLARLRKQMKAMNRTQAAGGGRGAGRRGSGMFPAMSSGPSKAQLEMGKGFDSASSAVSSLGRALAGATIKAGLLAGALAALGAGYVVKGIAEAVAFAERMQFAFTKLTGSAGLGQQAFKRSGALAQELGLNINDTRKQYAKLLAAQFSVGESENLIKLTSDLQAIGATADETSRAILAITQIKAKGRVQAEELLQLSEAGVSLDLIMKALAKSMGKNVTDVRKAMEQGAVGADVGIAAIQAAILKKVGGKAPGEAGKAFANDMLQGAANRLRNAPDLLFSEIAKASGDTGISKLTGIVKQLQSAFDAIDPKYAALAFHQVLDLASKGIDLAKEFTAGFGEGFGEIMRALDPGSIGDASKMFRQLGRDVATLTVYAIEAAKWVGKMFAFFASDTGTTILAVGGIAVGLFKLLGIAGAVAGFFGATAGTGLLASMGSFGIGAALVGKIVAGLGTVFVAIKGAAIAFGSALVSAFAPIAVPVLAAAAAFTTAYVAMKKLLDLTGGRKWLENFGASFAGPDIPRAATRSGGMGDDQRNGHAYAGAGLTTAPSALVKRDQVAETSPILAAAQKQAGNVSIANLTVQLPQSAASSPRSHASAFAAALKNELAGVNAAPAGG